MRTRTRKPRMRMIVAITITIVTRKIRRWNTFGPTTLPAHLGVVEREDIRTLNIPTPVPRYHHHTKAPSRTSTQKALSLSTTSTGVSNTTMQMSRLQAREVHTTSPPPRALEAM